MVANHDIDKLKINIMSIDDYQNFLDDESTEFSFNDLYVVGEYDNPLSLLHDPNNVISSKTYADVGREAVVTQNEEPTSPHTQIWIDPNEEVVYITPANADMDNITETGSSNIVKALAPDFTRGTIYSQGVGSTFTVEQTGWLYVVYGASSSIEIKLNNASGVDLVGCVSENNTKGSNHLLLEAGTTLFVNRREGTVVLIFYPCKGIA
jgi:hypothetical protein